MPTGRVRWFNAAKGCGFITSEEGKDVLLPAQTLPTGATTLHRGVKVEYPVVDGRYGPQTMDVRLIASAPSLVKAVHPKAGGMAIVCGDLIKMFDVADNTSRCHRHPSAADNKKLTTLLRAVTGQFDVQN